MRVDAGFSIRRAPGWPLAATLGAHLLLLWSWRVAMAPAPAPPAPIEHELMLLTVPAASPLQAAPAPSRPPPRPRAEAVAPSRPAPPATAAEQPEPGAISTPYADPLAEAAEQGAQDALAERARRAASPLDHPMRKGKLAVLDAADTPWKRFTRTVEGAYKDGGRTLTSESYTTPDGVTIYRFRRGGRVYCRTGGHVRPRIGGAEGGGAVSFDVGGGEGAAGLVACPAQAEFKPD